MPSSSIARSTCSAVDSVERIWPVPLQCGQGWVEASSSDGRRRWRDSSSRPKGLIRPIWMRARSCRIASFSRRSTAAVVAMLLHVDEVDDDQPGEIAQAQLPRDFLGGFEIGLERGLLDIALARRAARIHVDRDQRLGRVDDDVAAGAELHDGRMDRVELAFHLETMEERHRADRDRASRAWHGSASACA